MLPFIFALVFAVGLPLLPSSFHKALHLPALNFNFLSSRPAPEQILVSSQETTLLLEGSYPDVNPDSGGSPLYLVFPDLAGADCSNQAAAAPTCMSLTEKQDYPQPSIWNVIHTQLLYQLAEATIIIALSFFVTATLLSRCGLSTVMERLCTALLISRSYTPKAALSSFLQDVFHGLHKYWMNDSVCKGDAPHSAAKNSRQTALEVFTHIGGESFERAERGASVPSSTSVYNLQDNFSFVPLDNSNLCSGSSLSESMRLPRSVKTSPATNPAHTSPLKMPARPLCSHTNSSEQERPLETVVKRYPPRISQPTIISETTKHSFDMTKNETSRVNQICTAETPGPNDGDNRFPEVSSTMSLQPISIEDLYKSSRVSTAPITLPEPRRAQEASVSDPSPFSHSSCDHESLSNVNVTTPNLKFERLPSGSNRASSSKGSRRRYKSDVTCASWEGALQGGERRVEALVKEALPPASLPRSLPSPRIRRNRSEQGGNGPSVADAVLAGFVVTAEGAMIVPASQRPDGSMRKEIRLRTGHSLRESFTEKYLPPAARRRTSTWSPLLCENSASTPTSPHRGDSPLPSTPSSRQRPFIRQSNSPACLSDNWRRPSSGTTVGRTQPAIATILPSTKETEPSPVAVDTDQRNSVQEASLKQCSVPSAITSTSPTMTTDSRVTVPVIDQHAPVQAAGRPPSPATLDPSVVNEAVPINEGAEASNSVGATDDDDDRASLENQQPDVPSSTHSTSKIAPGKEGRRPLQDITFTFTVPGLKPIEYLAPTSAQTHSIMVADILPKDLLKTPTRIKINEDLSRAMREAALNSPRKRKPSPEPNEPMFRAGDNRLTPYRLPRGRHSAPHLGKYVTKQQAKAPRASQTPESSKRQRMRTASSRGVDNWTIALATPATTDHSGHMIVLPAGTGWKGRSSAVVPPMPKRQRQPMGTLA